MAIPEVAAARSDAEKPLVDRLRAHVTDPAFRSNLARDTLAGASAALVILSYLLSYSALMFSGELAAGFPIALWAMLFGSVVAGAWIAYRTSIPPIANGMDIPSTAVLIALCGGIAQSVIDRGGTAASAVTHALVFASMASLICALLMGGLGLARAGAYCRFVPYSVVAGFMAATGCLLLMGAYKLATGRAFSLARFLDPLPAGALPKLIVAIGFAAALFAARKVYKSPFVLPMAVVIAALVLNAILAASGGGSNGWYMSGAEKSEAWSPFVGLKTVEPSFLIRHLPEALVFAGITVISMVVKIAGLEAARATSADLDQDFRATGFANLATVPFGGIMTSILISPTRLMTDAGAATRWAGVITALIMGIVLFAKVNLPGLVPIPLLAGLVFVVGWGLFADSLRRPLNQRDWLNLGVAVAIMGVCLGYGYITGVVGGCIAACLMFAVSYSRIGAVRRHLTRASTASNVDHGATATALLQANGSAIHVFWLSGYVFFGSSDSVFEQVRGAIEAPGTPKLRYAVIDFTGVTGVDASAIMSFVKLKNFADRQGVTLVFTGVTKDMAQTFAHDGFFSGKSRHRSFPTRSDGIEWAERELLRGLLPQRASAETDGFEAWLGEELGADIPVSKLVKFFEKRTISEAGKLYQQGAAADAIDLVADGVVMISVDDGTGGQRRLRQMSERTLVGEMGFFRGGVRSAHVSIEAPVTLYTLTRASYERMQKENPAMASAFLALVIRTLASRLEFANREIAALQ